MDYTEEEINKANIEELWILYRQLQQQNDQDNKPLKNKLKNTTQQITQGINIQCSIWYFTKEWYTIYPATGRVKIKGYPTKITITEFMQEQEQREDLMRQTLIQNIQEDINQPRG